MADATIAEVWGTVRVASGLPYDPFRVLDSPFATPRL
jgi:methylmalonyl-CoA mutase N-terminal domain/subunit